MGKLALSINLTIRTQASHSIWEAEIGASLSVRFRQEAALPIRSGEARGTSKDPKALRTAPRRLTNAPAMLVSSAHGHLACEVDNLSRIGARILLRCRLRRGEHVMLTFPGMAPLLARVAWSLEGASGLDFVDALHAAVLDRLLRLYPPRPGSDPVTPANLP